MQAVKQTAANVAASALSGMEKTKAVVEEKVEKIGRSDPIEKDMATLRKDGKIMLVEHRKQEAYLQNATASANEAAGVGGMTAYTAVGDGHPKVTITTDAAPITKPLLGAQHDHGNLDATTIAPCTSTMPS